MCLDERIPIFRKQPHKTKASSSDTETSYFLSPDGASGSDITPCNKIDKPVGVYRLSNVT